MTLTNIKNGLWKIEFFATSAEGWKNVFCGFDDGLWVWLTIDLRNSSRRVKIRNTVIAIAVEGYTMFLLGIETSHMNSECLFELLHNVPIRDWNHEIYRIWTSLVRYTMFLLGIETVLFVLFLLLLGYTMFLLGIETSQSSMTWSFSGYTMFLLGIETNNRSLSLIV